MQRKSLGYLDELQELRKKSQEQQRLLSEQQAQVCMILMRPECLNPNSKP